MAIIKCKMCGGDLEILEDSTVCECAYCGTRQTVPSADNEKKLTLFARAGRFLRECEFDKAAGVYESIIADFDQEAEAYWGLILCRYGIEYVDDPATGKKVPTCHRSSFESVMDDADFERVMDFADPIARRVYRDEAKAIEELRKDILAVSSKEEPYDVFISYKEKADNGERTVDSVIAQDIYKALTDEGFRVFFSRISLEDKLGTEYEPYIFAALNSAKVMLVVGTDYDHFNAVWVKNEWSRFLKLIAKGEKKTLIPVFRDVDAYDLPKEFRHLTAQDMGKVGAMQDLVRGVEKILGKKQPEAAAPVQTVHVTSEADAKTVAALKRGDLALEDGEFEKAKEYYDQALALDAECAEAYVGLALAEEQCHSDAEYIRKHTTASPVKTAKEIPENEMRIRAAVEKYVLPGFLSEDEIRDVFHSAHRGYFSNVESIQKMLEEETRCFDQNRNLSRAARFAKGETAERLQKMRSVMIDALQQRIENAKRLEQEQRDKKAEAYEAHLKAAEEKTAALRTAAEQKREEFYQSVCKQQAAANSPDRYSAVITDFQRIYDYKDSCDRIAQCHLAKTALEEEEARRKKAERRAAEEAAAKDAEKKRIAKEKAAETRKKAAKIIAIALASAAVILTAFLVITKVVIPNNALRSQYNRGVALLESENDEAAYESAIGIFSELGDYKDSEERLQTAWDKWNAMQELKDQQAAEQKEADIKAAYEKAEELEKSGELVEAAMAFGKLKDYQDAQARSFALWRQIVPDKTIAAGDYHTVALKNDGTVAAAGSNDDGQCEVSDWKDVTSVAAGGRHTVGLKSDGTVAAAGLNDAGQCRVSGWENIVAIAVGHSHTVGLKSDGKVVATGDNSVGECDVVNWSGVIAVFADVSHTYGLRADGTVLVAGSSDNMKRGASKWENILSLAPGMEHLVSLQKDGSIVAISGAEDAQHGQCDVTGWSNISAISAGSFHTVGLKEDGTVLVAGSNEYGQCDISDWNDIVEIAAGNVQTIGLKSDGTVVAVGSNKFGQCDVSGWKDIKLPNR